MKFIDNIIEHVITHPEGMLLYAAGATTFTAIQIYFRSEIVRGLKGKNGEWESPEWTVYLFCWLFPHVIMADQFLNMELSTEGWFFMAALLLFAIAGRFGLEWLLALKTGSKVVEPPEGSSN